MPSFFTNWISKSSLDEGIPPGFMHLGKFTGTGNELGWSIVLNNLAMFHHDYSIRDGNSR